MDQVVKSLLADYRIKFDLIDQQLKTLLVKRLELSIKIGQLKNKHQLDIYNPHRETAILNDNKNYLFEPSLNQIYQTILTSSKVLQTPLYGLIGQNLKNSYSLEFHQFFGNSNYYLFETDDPLALLSQYPIKGANITIPYKTQIVTNEITSVITTNYDAIGTSNHQINFTINQDIEAFDNSLKVNQVDLTNKSVLIIGRGATARSVYQVLTSYPVKAVRFLVRDFKSNQTIDQIQNLSFLLSDYTKFLNYDIIINTTPYGSFNQNQLANQLPQVTPLFSLKEFTNLDTVIDVVYNPYRSPLLIEAQKQNKAIKTINGLYMLIECARLSESLWQNQLIDSRLSKDLYQKTLLSKLNFVLIGMPFSGKSTIGPLLANLTNHQLLDSDHILSDLLTVPEVDFTQFRLSEHQTLISASTKSNQVIVCGGGAIINPLTFDYLKQTSLIIFLDVELDQLLLRNDLTRPLIKNNQDLIKLFKQRYQLYLDVADITIKLSNQSPIDVVAKIIVGIFDYLKI